MMSLLLVIDLPRLILNITWVSLFFVIFIIAYRLLLRRMKKDQIDNSQYITLYPVEKSPASGNIQFYFTSDHPIELTFRLYDKENTQEILLFKGEANKGNTIIDFDTTTLPNGFYYYEIKTENQKTFKLLEVKNG
jgi:hypothetical protein